MVLANPALPASLRPPGPCSHDKITGLVSDGSAQVASSLAAIAADFYSRGWVLGTSGNLSAVISRAPLRLLITPSGADKGALHPDQFLVIDKDARPVGDDGKKPSDESPLHVRIAEQRLAGAVMHTHSVWGTMLSDLHFAGGGLRIEGYEMLKGLAGVSTHEHAEWLPIVDNSQDMPALADAVADMLKQNQAAHGFLVRRHGLYTWGATVAQAKRHVEILEFLLETIGRTVLVQRNC
jgi:methylthioribulose-1-phosphate dehydratase